ncbi:E3 ubiquitin-protein ligase TRIM17-like isoform X2 [Lissotriton helveticus]
MRSVMNICCITRPSASAHLFHLDTANAMASHDSVRKFQQEATCILCNRFFRNPVSIMCGHIFCKDCITQEWRGSRTQYTCPKCGKRYKGALDIWPNAVVGELADLARQFKPEHAAHGRMCQLHMEEFKFFCKNDHAPICPVCRVSKDHSMHSCATIEEAVMDYKARFRVQMDKLKQKKDEMLHLKAAFDKKLKELEKKAADEQHKVETEFGRQQILLEDEKKIILFQIAKEENDWKRKLETKISKVSSQTHGLEMLLSEIDEKNEEKGAQLLLGIDAILHRCENFKYEKPEMISPDIKKYISHFPTHAPVVQELLDDSPSIDAAHGEHPSDDEGLPESPSWSHGDMWGNESAVYLENMPVAFETSAPLVRRLRHSCKSPSVFECITMDPNTAHPSITLSEDLRSASRLSTEKHIYPDWWHFDTSACVLGSRGFTEGIHCWNVEVNAPLSSWAIGVALESVKRKESFGLYPSEGVWVLQMEQGYLQANTMPESYLPNHSGLTQITVCLNCEEGKVVFSNSDTEKHIHTFSTPFFKETVFPFFCLSNDGVHVKVSP